MKDIMLKMRETFTKLYGSEGETIECFAPGRVNLIGEHTDYNGGHVFPCALTLGTYGIIRPRQDRKLRFASMNFIKSGVTESSLDKMDPSVKTGWADYPIGVFWAFEQKKGVKFATGADVLIYGNIPAGSGLSSSASLEVLTGLMIKETYGIDITMTEIAQLGQFSENNYNGCNCGIMDQFASAMGSEGCAIFLDTSNLQFEYAPVKLDNAKIVITNSNVKHSLVGSAYNDRRNECETALKELQTVCDIKSLGDLSEEEFEANKNVITSDICKKRAKHAVYENQRTIKAVAALKANDIETFGKLMNASHDSLQYDYEVSCPEIDLLVTEGRKIPGVIGSRITGGGFGGCTVSIVKNDSVDEFQSTLEKIYIEKTGITPAFYVVDCGAGAHRL